MMLSLPDRALSVAELDPLDHGGVVRFVRVLERVPKSAAAAAFDLAAGYPGRYVLGLGVSGAVHERADGLITFLVTPEHTRWARETIGPDQFLSVVQWAVVDRNRTKAREVARERLAYYLTLPHQIAKLKRLSFTDADLAPPGSDRLVDALVAVGTVDQVRDALRAQYDAGATQVAVSLVGPLDDAKLDTYRALGKEN